MGTAFDGARSASMTAAASAEPLAAAVGERVA
jgi:hypothetical protein